MYISPRKKKQYVIAIIVGVILIVISVLAVIYFRDIRSKASVTAEPENIRITDVTESSAVVSWVTPQIETEGWVRYSESSVVGDGSQIAQDSRDLMSGGTEKRTTHYVLLEGLSEATTYYFEIGSGPKTYSSSEGLPFEINTASSSMVYNSLDSITGSVTNCKDKKCIVYITLQDESTMSSSIAVLVNDYGGFSAYLANIRDLTLESKFDYNDETNIVFEVTGGSLGQTDLTSTIGETLDGEAVRLTLVDSSIEDSTDTDIVDTDQNSIDTSGYTEDPNSVNIDESDFVVDSSVNEMDYISIEDLDSGGSGRIENSSNFRITNISENSFSIIWQSNESEIGYVRYGSSMSNMEATAMDDRDSVLTQDNYYIHHVTVNDLNPGLTYYYEVVSGSMVVGSVESIILPESNDVPPALDTISGSVFGASSANTVVLASLEREGLQSTDVSTVADANGSWVLNIGSIKTTELSDYFSYSDADTINIEVLTLGSQTFDSFLVGQARESFLEVIVDSGSGGTSDSVLVDTEDLPETAILGIDTKLFVISVGLLFPAIVGIISIFNRNRNYLWEKEIIRDLDL